MDNLAKAEFLAAQEGISYGNWMAKHKGEAMPEVVEPKNLCPYCKGEVVILSKYGKTRKFCSDRCRYMYNQERKRKR